MDNSLYDEQEPLSWQERLKYIFTSPGKLFSNLVQHPKILFPLLTIIIGMIVLVLIRLDLFREYMVTSSLEGANTETTTLQLILGMLGFALFPVVIIVIKSGFINGFVPIFGGDATYKHIFSVVAYAYLVIMVGEILTAILSLATGQFDVAISFGRLVPETMEGGYLHAVLSQIDIFIIWYQVLVVIGASYIYEIKRRHAAIPVLLTWLSWVLISSSFQVIGQWVAQNLDKTA